MSLQWRSPARPFLRRWRFPISLSKEKKGDLATTHLPEYRRQKPYDCSDGAVDTAASDVRKGKGREVVHAIRVNLFVRSFAANETLMTSASGGSVSSSFSSFSNDRSDANE